MSSDPPPTELACPKCGETSPEHFAICWNCGEHLENAEQVPAESEESDAEVQTWAQVRQQFSSRRYDWIELVAVVLATCGYGIVASRLVDRNDFLDPSLTSFLTYLPRYLGWSILLWLFVRRDNQVRQPALIKQCRWYVEIFYALLILLASWVLWFVVADLAWSMRLPFGKPPVYVEITTAAAWAIVTAKWFIAAIYEETLFRVYFVSKFESLLGSSALAIIISAALFTAVHGYAPGPSLDLFFGGLMFGAIYKFSRRIPRLVLAHWMYNLVGAYMRQHR